MGSVFFSGIRDNHSRGNVGEKFAERFTGKFTENAGKNPGIYKK